MPTRPPTHKRHSVNPVFTYDAKPQNNRQARPLHTWGSQWRGIRTHQLAIEPLCRMCARAGRTRAATQVDHIDGNASNNVSSNFQSLCASCHSRKTSEQDSPRVSLLPRWLPRPLIPVTVVCGPPASGKTTYVRERAGKRDLVLDVDEIAQGMGHGRDRTFTHTVQALRERNRLLASLSRPTQYPRCWLIVTAGSFKQRKFWAEWAGTPPVVVNPGAAVCKARLKDDPTRSDSTKRRQAIVVDKWC